MRILYADTGLRGLEGHITSSALALPPAFRRLGHEVTVLGQRDLVPSLREATGAVPLFQYYTWGSWSSDPFIGWLADFTNIVDATLADLHRGWIEYGPFDFIYVNTGRAAQLAAVGLWLKEMTSDQGTAPVIAFQLGPDPGLVRSGSQQAPVFTLRDPTTVLHRYAAHLVGKEWLERLTLVAVNETVAEEYSFIVDSPVRGLTTPEELPVPRRRQPEEKITIGFLGYQRIDKGYELLPDVIEQLLQIHPNVQFLVQHSDPLALAQDYPQRNLVVTDKLRGLADRDRRIELVLQPVVGSAWFDLIGRCDMVALPYDPVRYASSYSAIFGEALASGAPIVAPGGTTMAAEIGRSGGVGVSFSQWTAPSITSAISLAVDGFDGLAERAYQGGVAWRKRHGPDAYVAQVIEAADLGRALGAQRPVPGRTECISHRLPALFLCNAQFQNGASFKPDDNAIEYTARRPEETSSGRPGRSFLTRRQPQFHAGITSPPVEVINRPIETTAMQWHYALTFDVNDEIVGKVPANSQLTAEAIIEVDSGSVGIAWIDREGQLASPEQVVMAKSGLQRVAVAAGSETARRLMLRNVAPGERKATFTLKSLSATADVTSAVDPPDSAESEPEIARNAAQ